MNDRISADDLLAFSVALFQSEGLCPEMAEVVARGFIEAELLGFRSHGVVKIASNLAWLRQGETARSGVPTVLLERPAVASWDAGGLPGHWAMYQAIGHAIDRARDLGAFTMTIRNCQHVACLASTLIQAVAERMIVLMMVSSPDEAFVSPFGGSARLFSNNPMAFTAPGRMAETDAMETPILFDVSMAITAGSQVGRAARLGRRLPEASIKSVTGEPTDDPAALVQGGSVMPIGGLGHGHKGHALTIMTEVLTQALAGHGRSVERVESELNSVYLQVIDPVAFAATQDYDREIGHLFDMVQGSRPDDSERPVRMPGQRAWSLRTEQMDTGIRLDPGVLELLQPYAEDAGLALPASERLDFKER